MANLKFKVIFSCTFTVYSARLLLFVLKHMIGHFKYQISTGLGGDPSFFMKLPTLTMTQDGTLAQILWHKRPSIFGLLAKIFWT